VLISVEAVRERVDRIRPLVGSAAPIFGAAIADHDRRLARLLVGRLSLTFLAQASHALGRGQRAIALWSGAGHRALYLVTVTGYNTIVVQNCDATALNGARGSHRVAQGSDGHGVVQGFMVGWLASSTGGGKRRPASIIGGGKRRPASIIGGGKRRQGGGVARIVFR